MIHRVGSWAPALHRNRRVFILSGHQYKLLQRPSIWMWWVCWCAYSTFYPFIINLQKINKNTTHKTISFSPCPYAHPIENPSFILEPFQRHLFQYYSIIFQKFTEFLIKLNMLCFVLYLPSLVCIWLWPLCSFYNSDSLRDSAWIGFDMLSCDIESHSVIYNTYSDEFIYCCVYNETKPNLNSNILSHLMSQLEYSKNANSIQRNSIFQYDIIYD